MDQYCVVDATAAVSGVGAVPIDGRFVVVLLFAIRSTTCQLAVRATAVDLCMRKRQPAHHSSAPD